MKKLWNGRFEKDTDSLTDKFNASLSFDYRLLPFDIKASKAHVKGLNKANILNIDELNKILNGLDKINKDYHNQNIDFNLGDEDVHMLIERLLTENIGIVAKKVHTGRSRNDQVATATRLYLMFEIQKINELLDIWLDTLNNLADQYKDNLMPGLTHLQSAQPITLGFFFNAYYQMFKRDKERLHDCLKRVKVSPLGSGALAGSGYSIDRYYTAELLAFKEPCLNALDGVSDRDYIMEILNVISIIGIHFSKLAEEVILYNSPIYNYIKLDDAFSTGSSIMPQKKNPDIAELTRGKSARLIGNLVQILTLIKATPLAYNKDFQEDKEQLFDSIDTIKIILEVFNKMISTASFNLDKLESDCKYGYLNATDLADYLVDKGISFREAHKIVGQIVLEAEQKKITLEEVSIKVFKTYSEKIDADVYDYINIKNCMKRRVTYGGVGWFSKNFKVNKN